MEGPKNFTLAQQFKTQADVTIDMMKDLSRKQRVQQIKDFATAQKTSTGENSYNTDNGDIIDAEIVDDNSDDFTENNNSVLSVIDPSDLPNIPESDLAEIIATRSIAMENKKKAEQISEANEIAQIKKYIDGLNKTKAVFEKYLHIQESALEINPELILADDDRSKMTELKTKIRDIEFDVLSNLARIQYIKNKSEGKYKSDLDKNIVPDYDITKTGIETKDPEVIDTIIESIKNDAKYANNGRERIFEPDITYTGKNYSLPRMAKNIILNKTTSLEQAIELVSAANVRLKPQIIGTFLLYSPIVEVLSDELQTQGYRKYEERVGPIMKQFMDSFSYSVKQVVTNDLEWSGVSQLKAYTLMNLCKNIKNEKVPGKETLVDKAIRIGRTDIGELISRKSN
jgi:hypothetical protein